MVGHALQASSAGPSARAARVRRVLLVDDNADAASSLAKILAVLGYEVAVATSGAEALRTGARFSPDVVLLDLGMPEMDGFETAALLRREAWGAGVLLVALTGWGQPEDFKRTKQAGFAAHLVKPVKLDALLEIIRG